MVGDGQFAGLGVVGLHVRIEVLQAGLEDGFEVRLQRLHLAGDLLRPGTDIIPAQRIGQAQEGGEVDAHPQRVGQAEAQTARRQGHHQAQEQGLQQAAQGIGVGAAQEERTVAQEGDQQR